MARNQKKDETMDNQNAENVVTDAAAVTADAAAPAAAEAPKTVQRRVTAEQVAEIRRLRAIPHDTDATKPKFTHKQVADQIGVTPGMVSQVARNMTHKDPNYTPVYDGHQNTGPRKPKEAAAPAAEAVPADAVEADQVSTEDATEEEGALTQG